MCTLLTPSNFNVDLTGRRRNRVEMALSSIDGGFKVFLFSILGLKKKSCQIITGKKKNFD